MIIQIPPSKISGELLAPASKSSMQRACAAAILHNGTTVIFNAGVSNDDKAALAIIEKLGASITKNNNTITIKSKGLTNLQNIANNTTIHCGESGLSIRMFAPIVALANQLIELTGEGSLQNRPMHFFDEILPHLAVQVNSNNGKLPLQIRGPLVPKDITIDGSLSSQFLTGMLFAFGAAATTKITIKVNNLKSKPYIDLTLNVMALFGYQIKNVAYEQFIISPKKNTDSAIQYKVEGDWSSASFLLVAGAIFGDVSILGLDTASTQADKAILKVLQLCGASVWVSKEKITLSKATLQPFYFDATDCPDLFPPLVALAAYCNGTCTIKGIHRLAAKESDRAITLQKVFGQLGIKILLKKDDDEMVIYSGQVQGAQVSSHHDHRIAMAAAVAALGASSNITITEAEAVNKSYPFFYEDLKKIGVGIKHLI